MLSLVVHKVTTKPRSVTIVATLNLTQTIFVVTLHYPSHAETDRAGEVWTRNVRIMEMLWNSNVLWWHCHYFVHLPHTSLPRYKLIHPNYTVKPRTSKKIEKTVSSIWASCKSKVWRAMCVPVCDTVWVCRRTTAFQRNMLPAHTTIHNQTTCTHLFNMRLRRISTCSFAIKNKGTQGKTQGTQALQHTSNDNTRNASTSPHEQWRRKNFTTRAVTTQRTQALHHTSSDDTRDASTSPHEQWRHRSGLYKHSTVFTPEMCKCNWHYRCCNSVFKDLHIKKI